MRYAAIFIGIGVGRRRALAESDRVSARRDAYQAVQRSQRSLERGALYSVGLGARGGRPEEIGGFGRDRKSTRLNSSHGYISYAVFCLKKKKKNSCLLTWQKRLCTTIPCCVAVL